MSVLSLQELFESQSDFRPKEVGMLLAFNKLWDDHKKDTENNEFSFDYYSDLKAIADKFGVEYEIPKRIGQLKEVGSSTTLH